MYAIVLAGGIGSRLWPRSRVTSPKQLLDLVSEHTMLQETVLRLQGIIPIENIVIVTGDSQAQKAREQLPELNPENVLIEPSGRGTAPAIGLGLIHIERLAAAKGESDPVIGSFHADHVITKTDEFRKTVLAAANMAEQGFIVTLGIEPDSPHTGYGYIERGALLRTIDELDCYKVNRFVEKPAREIAEQYLATGRYSWNSGMFIWKLSTILGEYKTLQPELYAQLNQIKAAYGKDNYWQALNKIWDVIKPETIDVGIAEKSAHMAVLPVSIGWSDVGDWSVVAELIALRNANEDGNAIIGHHLGIETTNSLVYTANQQKLVATIGLEDIIVVDTPDVLLVCKRQNNQDVRKIVEKLKVLGLDKYL
ncbi:MAG: mannose-1-phosphate guanylyltransferase [Chloroflexi bacterium]|uniref:mannose-1-phosphate guanylyltransferase n=1 Tax=Candidatus Chlorohelix allophototropha TaxID=3003348 RepID=A0A8T7LY25_9CHLR|nr:mannose-1-phosphate guanylyltransferase [Chloroflexota bacterium]WJW67051.1 mannose-1-phosphate guanylyltransferase [Chloroflexota bacterium L227-S17]